MDRFDYYCDYVLRAVGHAAARAVEIIGIGVAIIVLIILIVVDWLFD
jgi:hypothetical protein